MLLRGSNGSGKSVTMQSVVPLLLDGNMSPERLDPFGSRDRKMSSYLLEEDDGREERTGYLYLELKRQNSDTYLTIGMGIRARRGKNLDKWYFSLTDGRRIGKDFFLYKDSGEKVTLSKKELENRLNKYVDFEVSDIQLASEILKQTGFRENIDFTVTKTPENTLLIRLINHLDSRDEINEEFVKSGIKVSKLILCEENLEEFFTRLIGNDVRFS